MVSFESSSLHPSLQRNTNNTTSAPTNQDSSRPYRTNILIFGTLSIVLIVVILISYRVYHEALINKRRKNKRPSIYSGRVGPISPVQHNVALDSSRVTSVYPVPVHNNTISFVQEELPPAYDTVIQLPKGQSDPLTRF